MESVEPDLEPFILICREAFEMSSTGSVYSADPREFIAMSNVDDIDPCLFWEGVRLYICGLGSARDMLDCFFCTRSDGMEGGGMPDPEYGSGVSARAGDDNVVTTD